MSRILNPNNLSQVERGDRLADINALVQAIKNVNCLTSAYGITAIGANQLNATQLIDVLNEVDTATSGAGVQLPSSSGQSNTPFQFCIVLNNTASAIRVYSRYRTGDFINNTAGSTGVSQAANTQTLYISARNGYWFSISGGSGGGGSGGTGQIITAAGTVTIDPTIFITQIAQTIPLPCSVSVDPTTLTAWTPYTVKDGASNAGTYNITITPTSGNFENQSSYVIFQDNGSVSFYSDGTNIWVYQ